MFAIFRVGIRLFLGAMWMALLSLCAVGAEPSGGPKFEGVWAGTLDAGAIKLRLVFDLKKNPDSTWAATMDSPDQNALGLKIDTVKTEKNSVVLELKRLGGVFEGKLSEDGKEIAGQWKQGGQSFRLILKPGVKLAPPRRPQEPQKPFPYDEVEVGYENSEGGAKFAGTLTLPRMNGPHPAMLLITGSGSQNRDEELFGHKPFLLLADFLSRRGIAVLRVDDRGVGGSTGEVAGATTDDFVGDALAGIEFLRNRTEIDSTRIGLLGHSEGANIAVEVAAKSDRVAFIVLMATTAVPGDELLFKQAELISRAAGATDGAIKLNRELQAGLFAAAKEDSDRAAAEAKTEQFLADWKKKLPADAVLSVAANDAALKAEVKRVLSPWFRRFLRHDPRADLAKVRCPVLALFGERDLQVAPSQNRPPLEAALKASGHQHHEVREFPSLNHLFQTCQTGSLSEYGTIEETISPDVLTAIGDWVAKYSAKK